MIMSHRPNILIDRRHVRARQISALLMEVIRRHIPWLDTEEAHKANAERDLHQALEEQLWCDGAQMITEGDRIRAGLLPRNVHGLTVEELQMMEAQMLFAMSRPPQMIISKEEMAEMEKHQSEWLQPGNIVSVPHPDQELVKALEEAALALYEAGKVEQSYKAKCVVTRHKEAGK